ncbi:HD domain-containing protein [Pseudoflavonifractor sp. 60]|uniref:CCA tRNA nucleotidyltransferase n=1 Tax=Pseudoflavonifractor sp. 60 TaxID=2304576 RepID=UPI00136CBB6D|nr:HD domain-containing protein [Pseudoflavonifractor sp. 60]NBI66030.1 HD domain-containing protein [Pseudoflavonifractor sp. 60]
MNFEIPSGAEYILKTLTGAGYEAWLVGGCVRDLLRGVPPHDWDICTSARPEETEACFAGRRIIEAGLQHGTVTILEGGEAYEVTTYRTEGPYSDSRRPDYVRFVASLEADLARRDFTMNAIALGLDGDIRDPFGGEKDIRAGLLRCVGDPAQRFQEDGLRVMRALRFGAVFGCQVEEKTARAIHENRHVLEHVAAERINVELCRLLEGEQAGEILRQYPDVLCVFWPELEPLVALEQNTPWHCWGGWEHTIHAVEAVPAQTVLRLAVLLHDIGKPGCKTTDENGIDHFYGHPAVSAELAKGMLRALKFDNETRKQVVTLVEYHDVQIPLRESSIRRWLGRLGPERFFQLLAVKRADAMGQAYEKVQGRLAELEEMRALAEKIVAQGQCFSLKDLAVNGRDVIAAGIAPGPEVGRVLSGLLERVVSGELPNQRERLLALLRDL